MTTNGKKKTDKLIPMEDAQPAGTAMNAPQKV